MDSQLEDAMLSSMSSFPPTSFNYFDLNIFDKSSSDGLEAWSPDEQLFTAASYGSQQSFASRPSMLSSSAETCDVERPAAMLPSVPNAWDTQALEGIQLCPNFETCNCSALKTIRMLHVRVEDCLSSEEDASLALINGAAQQQPQARATDVVLAQNSEATRVVHNILKCACSMRPQVQLLVANILEKLVKWCGAVVSSASEGAGSQWSQGGEQVRRQSIAIGAHQLEDDLDVPIIAHVMLGRLKKMEDLVDILSERMEESNARVGSRTGNTLPMAPLREVGLLEIVRDRLIVCLKRQIGSIREDALRLRQNGVAI